MVLGLLMSVKLLFHELSYVKGLDPPFCRYFQFHLSYNQQFVWYPGYHGYQFYAALPRVDLQWHLHCTLCITQWAKQRGQKESGDNSMTISKSFLLKYKSCNKKNISQHNLCEGEF